MLLGSRRASFLGTTANGAGQFTKVSLIGSQRTWWQAGSGKNITTGLYYTSGACQASQGFQVSHAGLRRKWTAPGGYEYPAGTPCRNVPGVPMSECSWTVAATYNAGTTPGTGVYTVVSWDSGSGWYQVTPY
jgi:hypothetical protein